MERLADGQNAGMLRRTVLAANHHVGRSDRSPTWRQSLVIVAASAFTPARIWATNMVEVGFPDGLLIWSGLMWLFGLVIWIGALRLGAEPVGATYATFWLLLALGSVGSIEYKVPGGTVIVLVLIVVFAGVAYSLREVKAFQLFSTWAVVTAIILPAGLAISTMTSRGESQIVPAAQLTIPSFVATPDVVILVFDAYASAETLNRHFEFDVEASLHPSAELGLRRVPEMTANYSLTHLSLASFFEMGYPVEEGVRIGVPEWADLLNVINGESQLVWLFRAQGYRFVMVESGWSAIRCAGQADICVEAPWFDDAATWAKNRSMLRDIDLPLLKESAVGGSLNSIQWLREELPSLLRDETPDLVFAHLLLPHPPLHVDSSCGYSPVAGMEGTTLASLEMTEDMLSRRKDGYVAQVQCANRLMVDIASELGDDSIVLAFGDHGSDSRAQLFKVPRDWNQDDLEERLEITFMTKDGGCELSPIRSLVNVGRRLISCLSDTPIELLDDRHFVAIPSNRMNPNETVPVLEVSLYK